MDEEDNPEEIVEKLEAINVDGTKLYVKINFIRRNKSEITQTADKVVDLDENPDEKKQIETEDDNKPLQDSENLQNSQKFVFKNRNYENNFANRQDLTLDMKKSSLKIKDYYNNLNEDQPDDLENFENLEELEDNQETLDEYQSDESIEPTAIELSPTQIYKEAISRIKNPFELNEDYPFRADFALGPRLKEKPFK